MRVNCGQNHIHNHKAIIYEKWSISPDFSIKFWWRFMTIFNERKHSDHWSLMRAILRDEQGEWQKQARWLLNMHPIVRSCHLVRGSALGLSGGHKSVQIYSKGERSIPVRCIVYCVYRMYSVYSPSNFSECMQEIIVLAFGEKPKVFWSVDNPNLIKTSLFWRLQFKATSSRGSFRRFAVKVKRSSP